MNKILMKVALTAFVIAHNPLCNATQISIIHDEGYRIDNIENITDQIPVIKVDNYTYNANWQFIPNVAQFKEADWSNCVGISHKVSRKQAKRIAGKNQEITFFFYVKGYSLVLENMNDTPPSVRVFQKGDAVFFSGEPSITAWWGSAPGLADGYIKQ